MDERDLFEYCKQIENEYSKAFTYGIGEEKWDGKKQALYAHGPLHGLYRENDVFLRKCLSQDVCREDLLCLVKKFVQDQRNSLERTFKTEYRDANKLCEILEKSKAEEEKCLNGLSESNIIDWLDGYNGLILEDLTDELEVVKLRFLELYIKYHYYRKNDTNCKEQEKIQTTYKAILADDNDYRRWHLIPISSERVLLALDDPRIYDKSIDKTVFLHESKCVISVLIELYNKGMIGKYSFLGKSIEDGKIELEYLAEAIEHGKIFSFDLEGLPAVSKLYSDILNSYDNQLWVKSEGNDLTFEELLEGAEDNDGFITTQMVHMQYKTEANGEKVISHLDHEYIFYSDKEYENRRNSMKQKGQAAKRKKTFKIDNARIPFDYPCKVFQCNAGIADEVEVPFIYFIINAYFENKDLVKEYFADLLRMD